MSEQKLIERMTGYKATNKDIQCCPEGKTFQFIVGEWYEYEGELKACKSGFHFCEYPSGPWAYYQTEGTRIWKIEAERVLDVPKEPGSDFKRVCHRIRLVSEITPGGNQNTGNRNTGNQNTGSGNVGDFHTGDLCFLDAPYYLFDKPAKRNEQNSMLIYELTLLLLKDEEIEPDEFLVLPNASKSAIKKLHNAHKKARKKVL